MRGDVEKALAEADVVVEGEYETGFVEHAYIEPEAGFARRVGDQIEIQACTQSPYMDRADIAKILGIAPEAVRIIPTAVGGGFGAKLDLSVQPFVALAAWILRQPVRMVYSRSESIISTTKRHPSQHSSARRRNARRQTNRRWTLPPTSIPAPIPRGGRRLRRVCRSMLRGHITFHTIGRSLAPSHQPGAGRRVPGIRRAANGNRAGATL